MGTTTDHVSQKTQSNVLTKRISVSGVYANLVSVGKNAKTTTTSAEKFNVKMEEHVKTRKTVTNVNADPDSVAKNAKRTTTSAEMFNVKMEEHVKIRDTVINVNADQDSKEDSVMRKNVTHFFIILINLLYYPLLHDYIFKYPNYFCMHF